MAKKKRIIKVNLGDSIKYTGKNASYVAIFCGQWDPRLSFDWVIDNDDGTMRILSIRDDGLNDLLIEKGQTVTAIEYAGDKKQHGFKVTGGTTSDVETDPEFYADVVTYS